MAAPRTHVKLGLFTLVALAAGLVAAFALGARSIRDETFTCHMYFDESVQGLELGSPVKYRGVAIGSVAAIDIAPDLRHVHVAAAINVSDVRRVGLAEARAPAGPFPLPAELRAQLGTQGITGVKYVNLDFFDADASPPPYLPFKTADGTIPVAPSFFKTLEDGAIGVVATLPEISATTLATLQQVELLVQALNSERLPERLAGALANMNAAVAEVRTILKDVGGARLPARLAIALDALTKSLAKVHVILEGVDGADGLLASTRRATDAFGDLGQGATGSTEELEQTLRDVGEAAQAIRELAQTLERDPDMLLKGRSTEGNP